MRGDEGRGEIYLPLATLQVQETNYLKKDNANYTHCHGDDAIRTSQSTRRASFDQFVVRTIDTHCRVRRSGWG